MGRPVLSALASVGLVLFMFLVGIQLDSGHLRANGRLVLMTSYASMLLPFGRSHQWGDGWSPAINAVLGGWQVSGTYQYQSGFPLTWASTYYDASCGDPAALVSTIGKTVNGQISGLDVPAWNTSCFYFHDAAVQTGGVDDPVKQRVVECHEALARLTRLGD